MASQKYNEQQKLLKKISTAMKEYTSEMIKADMEALEPKDRLHFFLNCTNILLQNKDLLASAHKKKMENVIIDFE